MRGETPVQTDRLWREGITVCGVVHGVLYNKSNSRQLVYVKGRPLFIKAKGARGFETQFREAVEISRPGLSSLPLVGATNQGDLKKGLPKLYLEAVVWQESLNRDLDIELLCDVLQKCGVINNDRAIFRKLSMRELDKDCPRTEFKVGIL